MLRDWGARDREFIALNARLRERLVALAGGAGTHVCVPLQGSGTFAVEPCSGRWCPGQAGCRSWSMAPMARAWSGSRHHERQRLTLETPEDQPNDIAALEWTLAADPAITYVAAVHCETTSGILNLIDAIAEITAAAGRRS
jgi:2-aminoethylphosphonate-pyruvate transaminase